MATIQNKICINVDSNQKEMNQNTISCCICMDSINKNKVTLECGHSFHYSCLFNWNKQKTSCPYCRGNIDDIEPSTPELEQPNMVVPVYELNLGYLVNTSESMGLNVCCKNCDKSLKHCKFCSNAYCDCPTERDYDDGTVTINAINPFEKDYSSSNSCSECFMNRHDLLTELVLSGEFWEDNLEYDIHNNEDLIEIYYTFFKNSSTTDYINEGFCENIFKDYSSKEFKDYVESIISQTLNDSDDEIEVEVSEVTLGLDITENN